MTNATKTLAIIFAGTLFLAFAATWGGGSTSSAAFQGQLLAVDTAQVRAVHIERTGAPTVRLERSDGEWSVAPADTSVTFPASAEIVQQTVETLTSLEVSAVATRQSDKHPRYGVDSTGTTVTMLGGGGETLGQLIVGRTRMRRSSSGGQRQNPMQRMRRGRGMTPITYVRSPDNPDVYSIEQSLSSTVSRSVTDWRDKRLWTVDQSQIQTIHFSYPADSSFTMQRVVQRDTTAGAAASTGTWISDGDTLATNETSPMVRMLSSPEADGFAEGTSPDALGDPQYSVELQFRDGSSRTLSFHPSVGDNYLVTADGYPYVARFEARRWDGTVLQRRSALLQSE